MVVDLRITATPTFGPCPTIKTAPAAGPATWSAIPQAGSLSGRVSRVVTGLGAIRRPVFRCPTGFPRAASPPHSSRVALSFGCQICAALGFLPERTGGARGGGFASRRCSCRLGPVGSHAVLRDQGCAPNRHPGQRPETALVCAVITSPDIARAFPTSWSLQHVRESVVLREGLGGSTSCRIGLQRACLVGAHLLRGYGAG